MTKTKWNLDPTHSEIGFKVKHLMITNVSGSFGTIHSSAETTGDDFTTANVSFTADINSISTNNEQRDGHLKSPDFFDAEKYPKLQFQSTKLEKKNDTDYILHGDLTIRDTTKPVIMDIDFGGIATDPYGNVKAGFSLSGKINRKEFGLGWNAPTEAGGLLVSEEVKINAEIQLVKQA